MLLSILTQISPHQPHSHEMVCMSLKFLCPDEYCELYSSNYISRSVSAMSLGDYELTKSIARKRRVKIEE